MLLIAKSKTKKGILKLIGEFYFSDKCTINESDRVINGNGKDIGFVILSKGVFNYFATSIK